MEPVERVPDHDEVDVVIGLDVFGPTDDPLDVVDAAGTRVRTREVDGLGLLIDGADLGEARRETERELARATRDVEQPAAAGRVRAATQILEHHRGIRHAEFVVEARGPAKQVAAELGLGPRRTHVERIDTPAVPGAP